MSSPIFGRKIIFLIQRSLILVALSLLVIGCSSDSNPTNPGVPFTEGLQFTLIVNGSWSADQSDPRGRTQGQVRVTVANKSKIWLGSDTMSPVSDTSDAERYSAVVRIGDLQAGAVTVRVVFQHYDSVTDREVVLTLEEVSTIDGNPIEIEDGKITDIGTIEVTIPQT